MYMTKLNKVDTKLSTAKRLETAQSFTTYQPVEFHLVV